MKGKIIQGIGGFYYVICENAIVYECKAKGIFRNQHKKPLVGDDCIIDVVDAEKLKGNITDILERKNSLIRPNVANVDQAVVIFAASYPKPNLNLLDRFLIMMKKSDIPVLICINKIDMVTESDIHKIADNYSGSDVRVMTCSAVSNDGIDELRKSLKGKTTVLAGPSGVGKSSIINALFKESCAQTGDISEKIKRGKHTTRYSILMTLDESTFIMDTPGFTSLELPDINKESLKDFYSEFDDYKCGCKFVQCMHLNEPGCQVKNAIEDGKISRQRYDNYVKIYEELKIRKKRY